MKNIESEIKSLIDSCFDVNINLTGNKLSDQVRKGKELDVIIKTAADKCADLLNNKYPDEARDFLSTGFIKKYIQEKTNRFLLG